MCTLSTARWILKAILLEETLNFQGTEKGKGEQERAWHASEITEQRVERLRIQRERDRVRRAAQTAEGRVLLHATLI